MPLKTTFQTLLCVLVAVVAVACQPGRSDAPGGRAVTAREIESSLAELLSAWYPAAVDEVHGGFLSRFDHTWEPVGPQNKMIVTQARHTWMNAKAAQFYPEDGWYPEAAAHGFSFLKEVMWDEEYGGFYHLVSREGAVQAGASGRITKRAYDNAFGIYGLTAYYRASGDTSALNLAKKTFHWLEAHSHDPVHGGYFQFMARDGTPMKTGYQDTPPKDQNSSIHLLEAFTALYSVWPDALLRKRLAEMLTLIRDTIVTGKGYMNLFFRRSWTPISYRDSSRAEREANYNLDHVSFGHDVETAYLMLEASHALGLEQDTVTMRVGKKMVDHALRNGWDENAGGFYDRGYYFKGADDIAIIEDRKTWWVQAEGLNTLLLMADHFPDDEMAYYDKFERQWEYIKAYLVDPRYGGWYAAGLDTTPSSRTAPKAGIWKGPYHAGRALMNCIRRLKN